MSLAGTLNLFYASLAVSLPTFGWVALGVALNAFGILPQWLNDKIALLAFRFGLPLMLFAGAAQVDYSALGAARYLLAGVIATLVVFAGSWLYTRWRGHPKLEQGIFVQAAFRSNLAIVGMALTLSAYGERGPELAALPVALMTVLYNILAVWVLDSTLGNSTKLANVFRGILLNPLVIGVMAGVCLAVSPMPVPAAMRPVGVTLSGLFLPLVLICIGGSMRFSRLYRAGPLTWEASAWRLVLAPVAGVLLALSLGVRDEHLGVLFLLLATPVAASSHVMVAAARGDSTLAANIIVLTTLLSLVTITAGFFTLAYFSMVGELQ